MRIVNNFSVLVDKTFQLILLGELSGFVDVVFFLSQESAA
jgi:hypothetical protein